MKDLYFGNKQTKIKTTTSYRGRETLEKQVGKCSHFASDRYIVHKRSTPGKNHVCYRITFFDVKDLHHTDVNISHCNVDVTLLQTQEAVVLKFLQDSKTIVFKAKVTKYEKKNVTKSRHEFDLFKRLDDFNNGRKLHESKPKRTFGLAGARLDYEETCQRNALES